MKRKAMTPEMSFNCVLLRGRFWREQLSFWHFLLVLFHCQRLAKQLSPFLLTGMAGCAFNKNHLWVMKSKTRFFWYPRFKEITLAAILKLRNKNESRKFLSRQYHQAKNKSTKPFRIPDSQMSKYSGNYEAATTGDRRDRITCFWALLTGGDPVKVHLDGAKLDLLV